MKYLAPVTSLLLGLAASGCTLIGYGVGLIADEHAARMPVAAVDRVRAGEEIEVHLVDGTVLRGRFASVERSFEDYENRYETARSGVRPQMILPPLGPARLSDIGGYAVDGLLVGFDPNDVWLRASNDGHLVRFSFSSVGAIATDTGVWPAPTVLAGLVRNGTIPSVSSLRFTSGVPLAPVPLNQIAYMSHRAGNNGRFVGTLIGVGADVFTGIHTTGAGNH